MTASPHSPTSGQIDEPERPTRHHSSFTQRDGFEPGLQAFELDDAWQHIELELDTVAAERYDVTGVFIGRVQPGPFDMRIDDVRFD